LNPGAVCGKLRETGDLRSSSRAAVRHGVNGIKLAGFGLGLAVTAAGMVALSVLVPVPQTAPTAAPPVVDAGPAQIDMPPIAVAPTAPEPTEQPAIAIAPEPLDDPAPTMALPETALVEPTETPILPENTSSPAPAPALSAPVLSVPDMASLPASVAQAADDARLALADTPMQRPAPITQPPFAAPATPNDGLPVPPDLPARAPEAAPQDAPAPDVAGIAPPAPEPAPEPEPAPAAPAQIVTPAPAGLPGRPVTGMPGQAASRDAPAPDEAALEAPLSALVRNAATADGVTGAPLMALVLNDPGLPQDARLALAARAIPFSVALNPMDPTAAEAATLYRAMGKEVFLLAAGLPDRATATDVDVTLSAYFTAVPEAAGLIDLPRDGAVRNARLLADVLQVVARDGHGMITFAGGLGQAARAAAAAGVPHAEVFRVLDPSDESPFTIRRFLDRAVFQASQLGQVVVYGEASNDAMLQALDLWQAEGRADQVALVPASRILLASQGLAP
jgi:uncharacterized protein